MSSISSTTRDGEATYGASLLEYFESCCPLAGTRAAAAKAEKAEVKAEAKAAKEKAHVAKKAEAAK